MAESVELGRVAAPDIMAVLKRQGVTDLQTLVEQGMAAAKSAPAAASAKGTGCCFICKGYIYIVLE